MKMCTIKLTPEFLTNALQGKAEAFASNLPTDIELLNIKYDMFSKQVLAIVRSNNFDDVAESQPIPEFSLVYSPITKDKVHIDTKSKTKIQPKAVSTPEVNTATKPQTQSSEYTSSMEEEFSPEQRKLLSFKVEGDQLIVKPIQFLSAEWEDINEIVRSLGGKWVKGDIISYWSVPLQQQS
jgi:hypothetical protein